MSKYKLSTAGNKYKYKKDRNKIWSYENKKIAYAD